MLLQYLVFVLYLTVLWFIKSCWDLSFDVKENKTETLEDNCFKLPIYYLFTLHLFVLQLLTALHWTSETLSVWSREQTSTS